MNFISVTHNNFELFEEMYIKYIENDISRYSNCYKTDDPLHLVAKQEAFDYTAADYPFDIDFICGDSGKFVGFIISCGPRCPYRPEGSDFHIQEFYIEKKYRRLGIGSKVVDKFLEDKKGKLVSLHILNKNAPALRFWHKVFDAHTSSVNFEPDVNDHNLYTFTVK